MKHIHEIKDKNKKRYSSFVIHQSKLIEKAHCN